MEQALRNTTASCVAAEGSAGVWCGAETSVVFVAEDGATRRASCAPIGSVAPEVSFLRRIDARLQQLLWVGWSDGSVVAFDPEEVLSARGTGDVEPRLLHPSTPPHTARVTGIEPVCSSGETVDAVVTASADGNVLVWSPITVLVQRTLATHVGGIGCMAVWGNVVLTSGISGGVEVRVWDAQESDMIAVLKPAGVASHGHEVTCVAVHAAPEASSPSSLSLDAGSVLATLWCGTSGGEVKAWSLTTATLIHSTASQTGSPIVGIAALPPAHPVTGDICAVDSCGTVSYFDVATASRVHVASLPPPTGTQLASYTSFTLLPGTASELCRLYGTLRGGGVTTAALPQFSHPFRAHTAEATPKPHAPASASSTASAPLSASASALATPRTTTSHLRSSVSVVRPHEPTPEPPRHTTPLLPTTDSTPVAAHASSHVSHATSHVHQYQPQLQQPRQTQQQHTFASTPERLVSRSLSPVRSPPRATRSSAAAATASAAPSRTDGYGHGYGTPAAAAAASDDAALLRRPPGYATPGQLARSDALAGELEQERRSHARALRASAEHEQRVDQLARRVEELRLSAAAEEAAAAAAIAASAALRDELSRERAGRAADAAEHAAQLHAAEACSADQVRRARAECARLRDGAEGTESLLEAELKAAKRLAAETAEALARSEAARAAEREDAQAAVAAAQASEREAREASAAADSVAVEQLMQTPQKEDGPRQPTEREEALEEENAQLRSRLFAALAAAESSVAAASEGPAASAATSLSSLPAAPSSDVAELRRRERTLRAEKAGAEAEAAAAERARAALSEEAETLRADAVAARRREQKLAAELAARPHPSDIEALSETLSGLRSHLETLRGENATLATREEEASSREADVRKRLEAAQTQAAQAAEARRSEQGRSDTSHAEAAEARRRCVALEEKLRARELAEAEAAAYHKRMSAELETQQRRAEEAAAAHAEELQRREEERQQLLGRVEASLHVAGESKHIAERQATQAAEHERRLATERDAREAAEEECARQRQRAQELTNEVAFLTAENKAYEEQKARADASGDRATRALEDAAADARSEAAALREDLAVLNAGRRQAEEATEAAEAALEAAGVREAELRARAAQEAAAAARAGEERVAAARGECEALQAQVQGAEDEVARMRLLVDEAVRRSEEGAGRAKAELQELGALREENAGLRKQVGLLQDTVADLQIQGAGDRAADDEKKKARQKEKQEVKALHQEAVKLATESQSLTAAVREAEAAQRAAEEKLAKVENRAAELARENVNLAADIARQRGDDTIAEARLEEASELRKEVQSLQQQHSAALKQSRDNEQRVSTMATELAQALSAKEEATHRAAQEESLRRRLERQASEHDSDVAASQGQVAELQQRLQAAETSDAAQRDAAVAAAAEAAQMRDRAATLDAALRASDAELQQARRAVADLSAQADTAAAAADAAAKSEQQEAAAQRAAAAVEEARRAEAEARAEAAVLARQNGEMTEELTALSQDVVDANTRLAQAARLEEMLRAQLQNMYPEEIRITDVSVPSLRSLEGCYAWTGEMASDSPVYATPEGRVLTQSSKGVRVLLQHGVKKGMLCQNLLLPNLIVPDADGPTSVHRFRELATAAPVEAKLTCVGTFNPSSRSGVTHESTRVLQAELETRTHELEAVQAELEATRQAAAVSAERRSRSAAAAASAPACAACNSLQLELRAAQHTSAEQAQQLQDAAEVAAEVEKAVDDDAGATPAHLGARVRAALLRSYAAGERDAGVAKELRDSPGLPVSERLDRALQREAVALAQEGLGCSAHSVARDAALADNPAQGDAERLRRALARIAGLTEMSADGDAVAPLPRAPLADDGLVPRKLQDGTSFPVSERLVRVLRRERWRVATAYGDNSGGSGGGGVALHARLAVALKREAWLAGKLPLAKGGKGSGGMPLSSRGSVSLRSSFSAHSSVSSLPSQASRRLRGQ